MQKTWFHWVIGFLVLLTITVFAFTFILYEGNVAVITRFGAPRAEISQAGVHWKLPWPFENVFILDGRGQYLDSGFSETLTRDKRNIILQTYIIWSVNEPQKFMQSIGASYEIAERHLNSLITNAKNGVLGRYDISALVSTNTEELKITEIEDQILQATQELARDRYGIDIHQIGVKRLGLPEANIFAVLQQMRSERRQLTAKYTAEGLRDASQIRNETDILAAQLQAEGKEIAAEIIAQTEAEVARIYAEAYAQNQDLFLFLRRLDSMEKILGPNSTLIFRTNSSPFNVLQEHFKEEK